MTDGEMAARVIKLETELGFLKEQVPKLGSRDEALDAALRAQAKDFALAMETQAKAFSSALKELTASFVAKAEWDFWKPLLSLALMGLIGLGWATIVGRH